MSTEAQTRTLHENNRSQIADWDGEKGRTWVRLQENLDRMMAPLMAPLIEAIAPRPENRILDVGCGCGALSLGLAALVAPPREVTGVDVSRPMLSRARSRSATLGLDLHWLEGDASVLAFEPTFHRVVSRFGVMFFAEPVAAFANLRRALGPDGSLVFACWRSASENSWVEAPTELVRRVIDVPSSPAEYEPGPFSLADRDRLVRILRAAGFARVSVERVDATLGKVGESAEEVTEFYARTGPMSRFLGQVDGDIREELLRLLRAWVRDEVLTGRFTPRAACWIVSAVP